VQMNLSCILCHCLYPCSKAWKFSDIILC